HVDAMGAQGGGDELAAAEKIGRHRPTSSVFTYGHLRRCGARTEEACCTGMFPGQMPYNRWPLSASWNRDPAGRARRAGKKLLVSRQYTAAAGRERTRFRTI